MGPRRELLAAGIKTALGKRKDGRTLFIGTKPSSDAHFFAPLPEEGDPSVKGGGKVDHVGGSTC